MSIPPPYGSQQPQDVYQTPQPQAPNPHAQGPHAQRPHTHGPHPDAPYQVRGQGYTPFARPAPVNGVAIAALVLGLLWCLPAVGLVLGIIALVQIQKRGERGKGMAIAGAVLSSLGVVPLLFTIVVHDAWEGFVDDTKGSSNRFLAKGDCFDFDEPPFGFYRDADHVGDTVSCSYEHDAEVFGTILLSNDDYPGDDYLSDKAERECWTLKDAYAMDHWRLTDKVGVNHLTPTAESWALRGNKITCIFTHISARGTLWNPLHADESTLDADQLVFLKAMNAVDAVLHEKPDEDAAENLGAHKDWAAEVRDVLGAQADTLRSHTWPGHADKSVDALVGDMQDSRADWTKAATASDAHTYYLHYESGYKYVEGDTTVAARRDLRLAFTPPSRATDRESGMTFVPDAPEGHFQSHPADAVDSGRR